MKRLIPITLILILFACQQETPLNQSANSHYFEVDGILVSSIYLPSSFTPDGDNVNEFFSPLMTGIEQCSFSIYSKSQLIYNSDQLYPSWDGRIAGRVPQSGIYTWKLTALDTIDNKYDMAGEVNLLL
jgi:hypothetical protein